ncbi:hypothetical protein QYE76_001797 [Lolium multiflorum]|uniref:Transposase (putative) gypsy type domain-containing protein n=1 Tax=Lolium multiflorum TaxID=4521 RepID=A0AAD8VXP1_LOLMU|nr:hypothetical protein QYE76_001797 [Lolium multiflorum]
MAPAVVVRVEVWGKEERGRWSLRARAGYYAIEDAQKPSRFPPRLHRQPRLDGEGGAGDASADRPKRCLDADSLPGGSGGEASGHFPRPPNVIRRYANLAHIYGSTAPGRIPSLQELQEELEGQARMAAKVQEVENKRASKARIREGERGQWWPCATTDVELRELQNEGMISTHWSFTRDSDVPKPEAGEIVMTKAWVERGLSLPCSEFFLSVLNTYGLQPHNICPNSYLLLSNFVTLCEGHLGILLDAVIRASPVKKETTQQW